MRLDAILVIDGNEARRAHKHVSVGGTASGEGYVATLQRLKPGIECDIVRPADEVPKLPEGVALESYHGAVITGSALNIYSREAAVERADRSGEGSVRGRCALFWQLLGTAGRRHGRGRQRGAQSAWA